MPKERSERVTLKRKLGKYLLSAKYAFGRNKPTLIRRTAANYLHRLFTGKPRLRYVDLAVSYSCNLDCIHCSASKLEDTERKPFRVEDYCRIGDELERNGVLVVQLTGGEPLVHPQLEQIVRNLKPERFFISINTNTSMITRERLIALRDAGVDNLCISMDDWDAEEHDRWRGEEGTHQKSLDAVDMALEVGLRVMILTVATHQNVQSQNFLRLVRYTQDKRILLVVAWAVPTGNWNANDEILLTDDDLQYLERLHERHVHVRTDFEANYFDWGCGAGKEKLYVTPYGDVMPCPFIHIRLGNIFEKSLKQIRDQALTIGWFRDYNHKCLAANDREFQSKHLARVFEADLEPISMRQAGFDLDE